MIGAKRVNLEAIHDSRKSFYGKAVVEDDGNKKQLTSYTTVVARITAEGIAEVYGTYSMTTLRHIKEFLRQAGFKAESKDQIVADYAV